MGQVVGSGQRCFKVATNALRVCVGFSDLDASLDTDGFSDTDCFSDLDFSESDIFWIRMVSGIRIVLRVRMVSKDTGRCDGSLGFWFSLDTGRCADCLRVLVFVGFGWFLLACCFADTKMR